MNINPTHTSIPALHQQPCCFFLQVAPKKSKEKFSFNRCVELPPFSAVRGFLFVLVVSHFSCLHLFSPILTSSSWATSTVWPDISASPTLIRPTWPLLVLHHYFPYLFGFVIFSSLALFRLFLHLLIFSWELSFCALPLGILKNALFSPA